MDIRTTQGWACLRSNPLRTARLRAATRSTSVRRDSTVGAAYADVDRGLFIVAGGVAACESGALAIDAVVRYLDAAAPAIDELATVRRDEAQIATWLAAAVRAAHRAVREAQCGREMPGPGIALDVVLVAGHRVFVAHVGDTRTYLFRGGLAMQLTRDHTMAELRLFEGAQVGQAAERSVLVNSIGARAEVCVDVTHVPVLVGDQLLLCSGGLYQPVPVGELAARLIWRDPELGLISLIDLARSRSGRDDVTGVLVDVIGGLAGEDLQDASNGVPVPTDDADDTEPSEVLAVPIAV